MTMRTLLENLKEDERDTELRKVKVGGRFVVNDIGQAIFEIERLRAAIAHVRARSARAAEILNECDNTPTPLSSALCNPERQ
jgi:hypothetical protein